MTKRELMNEVKEMALHNLNCYSINYGIAKQGYEKEWIREKEKIALIDEILEMFD